MWLKKDYNSETQVQLTCTFFKKKRTCTLQLGYQSLIVGGIAQDKRLQKGPISEILKIYIFQKCQEIHFS